MAHELFDVNSLKIAKPCTARWSEMDGDERARFCAQCKKSVYNVEGMTRLEVSELIQSSNTMPCMRLRRRKDGTVLTRDCPVGALAMWRRTAVAGLCGVFLLLSGLGLAKDIASAEPNYDEPKSLEELARGMPVIGAIIERISPAPVYTVGVLPLSLSPSPPPSSPSPTGPGLSTP